MYEMGYTTKFAGLIQREASGVKQPTMDSRNHHIVYCVRRREKIVVLPIKEVFPHCLNCGVIEGLHT